MPIVRHYASRVLAVLQTPSIPFFSPSFTPLSLLLTLPFTKRGQEGETSKGEFWRDKSPPASRRDGSPLSPPPRQPAVPHPQVAASPQRLSDPPPCVQRGHPPSGGVTGCSPHQRLRGAVRSLTRRRPRERACRALFAITANHTHHHHF